MTKILFFYIIKAVIIMIDTHCHILKEDYEDREEVIKKMKDNIMIVSSANPKDFDEIIYLINKYKNVYGTIGMHPEYASEYTKEDLNRIDELLENDKIVGVGEIGLDYHYQTDNIEKQKELFIKQIELGNKHKKTLVIHSRDAKEDTYNILKKYKDKRTKADMHCYSYDLKTAQKFIEENTVLGIGGILTFKKEETLKEIVKELDIKNFVLETDSPYLTPEPLRGKRNEPINITLVAKKIAELKNMEYEEVLNITTQTALKQFNINE